MAKLIRKFKTEKRYTVHFICNGFCYKSTGNCPWSYVKECRARAKESGETIEVEYERTIKHDYSYYA